MRAAGEDVEKSISGVAKFGYDAIDLAQAFDVATEYRVCGDALERRCSPANGGCGRLRAARRPRAGPRRSEPKAKNPTI